MIDFTVISSKNVTLRLPDDAKGPKVEGKDMVFCAPYFGMPNLKQAVDKAIESAGPGYDALIDGVVFNKSEFFKSGYVVTGTPIKTSKLKASE
jgi:hypothetical protein